MRVDSRLTLDNHAGAPVANMASHTGDTRGRRPFSRCVAVCDHTRADRRYPDLAHRERRAAVARNHTRQARPRQDGKTISERFRKRPSAASIVTPAPRGCGVETARRAKHRRAFGWCRITCTACKPFTTSASPLSTARGTRSSRRWPTSSSPAACWSTASPASAATPAGPNICSRSCKEA